MTEKKSTNNSSKVLHSELTKINTKTEKQSSVIDKWASGKDLILDGCAGTGKTFMALYLALDTVLKGDEQDNIVIVRSVVPTREMGFLPGTQTEKEAAFTLPYQAITNELIPPKKTGGSTSWNKLTCGKVKNRPYHTLSFTSTSFIRGLTLNNSVVIIDESQNLNFHEISSVITRLGKNTRFIMCGDAVQTDFKYKDEMAGLNDFYKVADLMDGVDRVTFTIDDIQRSGKVKDFIKSYTKLVENGEIKPFSGR